VANGLADTTDLEVVISSDRLVTALGDVPKDEHLRGWLTSNTTENQRRRPDVDRKVDLAVLQELSASARPRVVESVALPMLLPVDNVALIVELTGSLPVRARRIRDQLPGVSLSQARTIVDRKDYATCVALRNSWGIDIGQRSAARWRVDLSVGCPHPEECPTETRCTKTVIAIVRAAVAVYRSFLSHDSGQVVVEFRKLVNANGGYVGRCMPLLLGPGSERTLPRWSRRLFAELQMREGLL
jgi:hypothetical protein